jgi:hypothetical protein
MVGGGWQVRFRQAASGGFDESVFLYAFDLLELKIATADLNRRLQFSGQDRSAGFEAFRELYRVLPGKPEMQQASHCLPQSWPPSGSKCSRRTILPMMQFGRAHC